jgi:hypothetical protein
VAVSAVDQGVGALLALSVALAECDDPADVLRTAADAIPALGRARLQGFHLVGEDVPADLEALGEAGGAVGVPGATWAWAYPLRDLGHLVVSAAEEPPPGERYLLRVLAQQAGAALAATRRETGQRADAARLRTANAALAQKVAELERRIGSCERLSAAAAGGPRAVADALHEITGYPVVIEDRHGNLRTWAGPGRPARYPKQDRATLRREPGPVWRDGRLITPAGPHGSALALIDPDGTAGGGERAALEYAAAVLSPQMAERHSLAEAELRLGRDLVGELLGGADEETVLAHAEALGYDLERPHRVVVVDGSGDDLLDAVRHAARDLGVGSLATTRHGQVVLLSDADTGWRRLHDAVRRRVGVGGSCAGPSGLPRSYREARLALDLRRGGVIEFDRLGVYRLLAEIPTAVERFVREWLGPLIDYDAERRSQLVATLSSYLECGRRYRETTAALAIHRSTLKYRLRRVSELSGRDLADPDTCFNLQLATRAWNTLRVIGD